MNLKQLLGLCEHIWVIINTNKVTNEYGTKIGDKYHLQCTKCGNIKIKTTES